MSLNSTPMGNRIHIAFLGKRNVGKSSLINAITNQEISIVSEHKGTTTDPVYKAMEMLPLGPVVLIDTAGIDDSGELGKLRVDKTMTVLNKADIVIYVFEQDGITVEEFEIIEEVKRKRITMVGVLNKTDLYTATEEKVKEYEEKLGCKVLQVSTITGYGVEQLRKHLASVAPNEEDKFKLVGDLLKPGDLAILVTPIDKAAPKGRLILPQQQVIRDILESDGVVMVVKEFELRDALDKLKDKPKIVITDSQVFLKVVADVPKDVALTSFSILFARYKGDLDELIKGAKAVENLKDGDKILIAEACTHHKQADDIGTVKIPRWIRQQTGKNIVFEHVCGDRFPDNIKEYSLIVQCGGCMINRRNMMNRIQKANAEGVPITNYGVLIAYVQGILGRVVAPFGRGDE